MSEVSIHVTALLLKEQGYDVIGNLHENWGRHRWIYVCTATEDYKDVAAVADQIGILLLLCQLFEKEYWIVRFLNTSWRNNELVGLQPDVIKIRKSSLKPFLDYA